MLDVKVAESRPRDRDEIEVPRSRRVWPSMAWFAGADVRRLRKCHSDRLMYNGLGFALLLAGVASGLAFLFAGSMWLRLPASRIWPFAVLWAVLIINIDRLLQMVTAARRHFWSILPRLAISIVLGILIAEPLMLRFFNSEISNQLQQTAEHRIHVDQAKTNQFYGSRISADQQKIAAIDAQQNQLQQQIDTNKFQASCELGLTDCSNSHELGDGPYYQHYEQLVTTEEAQLAQMQAQNGPELTSLNADIAQLRNKMANEDSSNATSVTNSTGLIAREEALAQLEAAHPGINFWVWMFRIFFVLLDVLPLVVKFIYLSCGRSAYEELTVADKRQEGLLAYRTDKRVDIETARIDEEAEAEKDFIRHDVQLDLERRIAAAEAAAPTYRSSESSRGREPRVEAFGLTEFADNVRQHKPWEGMAVNVPPMLRRGAWIGTALVASLGVVVALVSLLGHSVVTGAWLVLPIAAAVGAVAGYTRGFRRAPKWVLRI